MGPTMLVGREREVDVLRAAIARAQAGIGQVAIVEGEPGIGKTRLVSTAVDDALAAGFDVFVGGFNDLAPARPFGPLLDALRITGSLDPDRAAVASLIDSDASSPAVASSTNAGLQYRVVEALSALVERFAERGPVLLAVEDLHWADASSLVALRSIARRAQTLPVALLLTWRVGHEIVDLHRLSEELRRADAAHVALKPLDDASVVSLVADVLRGRPSENLLARVKGASGNPLFVIEYVRAVELGAVDAGESGESEFRVTVLRRLAALSDQTREVLRIAALLGATFTAGDLSLATGRPMVQLVSALHEAAASGIVEERGDELAFRHALVRDAIYEQVPVGLRRELHREIGRTLAAAGANALSIAHHLSLGARDEDPEAADWLRRAARAVVTRAPATAVDLLERARDLLGVSSPMRDPLLAQLAIARAWSGRLAEAEALAIDVLSRRPDPAVAGSLRCELVYALTWQGKSAAALQHTVLAEDERISDWDAALLEAESAVASAFLFDFGGALAKGARAEEWARKLGHDRALCHALSAQAFASVFAGSGDAAIEFGRRAVEVADNSANADAHLAHPRFFLGSLPLVAQDQFEESAEVLRAGLRIAESLGLAWSFPLYHSFLGAGLFCLGDLDGAIAECETALTVADEVGLYVGFTATAAGWLAHAQIHRDDLEGAERTIAAADARLAEEGLQLGMGPFNAARARLLDARGERGKAITVLQTMWDTYQANGRGADGWTTMGLLRLLIAEGDYEAAAEVALPDGDVSHRTLAAGNALQRGLVARDADLLVDAVARFRAGPHRLDHAAACEDAARVLADAGRLDEAVSMWDEAISIYERLAAERDLARVGAALRQHGVKRGSRKAHVRATSGWESLTGAERKVATLVGQHLSNPEIAERLYVSRHTVESHLKSIYRKLGHSSRVQLALEAAQQAE